MLAVSVWIVVALILVFSTRANSLNNRTFPEGFTLGAATSSYQIEGAWDTDGKGVNVWDRITHRTPQFIADGGNGDIACDSYHKYLEDVELAKNLGLDHYRFSLSWSRILPTGFTNRVNPYGIAYYNNLINALLANGIQPMITIFHWDLPVPISDLGGTGNDVYVRYFTNFARVAFDNFGDRVKYWITYNEPKQMCLRGADYGFTALDNEVSGIYAYLCAHNILKSHAKVYHLYNDHYKARFGGSVGIVLDMPWFVPASENPLDIDAAERYRQFLFGWFAHPIFIGNYPPIMIQRVAERSALERFRRSRLPVFAQAQIDSIRGSYDFLGLNTYNVSLAAHQPDPPIDTLPSWAKDASVNITSNFHLWNDTTLEGELYGPYGFRKLLNWIRDSYGNITIIVTENGYNDEGVIDDVARTQYYQNLLSAALDVIYEDRINLVGYTAWSLLDNFEWFNGYTVKFGLTYVDFNDPNRTRTPKSSYYYYANVTSTRCVLPDGSCVDS